MKIYRCDLYFEETGTSVSWYANKADADAALKAHAAECGLEEPGLLDTVEPVNIPTDKQGLIAWLNQHFKTDNG